MVKGWLWAGADIVEQKHTSSYGFGTVVRECRRIHLILCCLLTRCRWRQPSTWLAYHCHLWRHLVIPIGVIALFSVKYQDGLCISPSYHLAESENLKLSFELVLVGNQIDLTLTLP